MQRVNSKQRKDCAFNQITFVLDQDKKQNADLGPVESPKEQLILPELSNTYLRSQSKRKKGNLWTSQRVQELVTQNQLLPNW
jgi:hypothetical protein